MELNQNKRRRNVNDYTKVGGTMAGRPRLVHEGSPILDDGDDDAFNDTDNSWIQHHEQQQSALARRAGTAAAATQRQKQPFKLKTRLVIGDVTHEDDEVMGDTHTHQVQTGHHHYGQNHTCHTHHQQHDYTLGATHSHNNLQTEATHQKPPIPSPLIVIDGANIAYNYAESLDPSASSLQHNHNNNRRHKRQPNPRGIRLAIDYFLKNQCRVQAVVPTSWYRLRPRDKNEGDAKMVTDEVEELRSLREQGFLVACPPGDDDDAYAIALARRESENRPNNRSGSDDAMMSIDDDDDTGFPATLLGGYIVSNDFFHDAVRREEQSDRAEQHLNSLRGRKSTLREWLNQHRISYSFANVGQTFHGQVELEFLPNPRHPLIECIDARNRFGSDL